MKPDEGGTPNLSIGPTRTFKGRKMAKRKIVKINDYELIVNYICPNTKMKLSVTLDQFSFDFSSSPCELCGDHGYLEITLPKCTECGKAHEISLREW